MKLKNLGKQNNVNILSSKSENRFLVNFQMKNAITPMTATPPATDIPIIEPVLRLEPPLVLLAEDDAAAEAADGEFDDSVCVKVSVPTPVVGVEVTVLLAVVPALGDADDADAAAVVCCCGCCCCCCWVVVV
jgi:hypothetical protein